MRLLLGDVRVKFVNYKVKITTKNSEQLFLCPFGFIKNPISIFNLKYLVNNS